MTKKPEEKSTLIAILLTVLKVSAHSQMACCSQPVVRWGTMVEGCGIYSSQEANEIGKRAKAPMCFKSITPMI